MLNKIKSFIRFNMDKVDRINYKIDYLSKMAFDYRNDLKSPKVNLGQIQTDINNKKESIKNFQEVEFQVFSQWGDDGIIQYLINKIDIPNKTFIEFGVENYTESNTRFLLINNNWTGYVLDGSEENISFIKNDIVSWACELYAQAAFITAENINELLEKPKFNSEIGILSIDIDGVDYWVWKAINCINPIIIIAEYNSLFGKNTSWTVPYDPAFIRSEKHSSILYYGASLKALVNLSNQKGYSFVGCNTKGNNAYFIRNDKVGNLQVKTSEEGFVLSKFREAFINGERISGLDRIKLIEGLEVIDIENDTMVKIDPTAIEY